MPRSGPAVDSRRGPPRSSRAGAGLDAILRDVSRSFYLSLALLPRAARAPASVAYLLARAADTVADTDILPAGDRMTLLVRLRSTLSGAACPAAVLELAADLASRLLPDTTATAGEAALLARLPEAFAAFAALPDEDRVLVADVFDVLTTGMIEDLMTFRDGPGAVTALPTRAALDRYTYLVAGCVGRFWSRLLALRVRLRKGSVDRMIATGIDLGKGLQLVNVLRDLPRDLLRGRCYLPAEDLRALGLPPGDLRDPASLPRVEPLLRRLGSEAAGLLLRAVDYTGLLPRSALRLRLAAALPAMLGLATLRLLDGHPDRLRPEIRLRISRRDVRRIARMTLLRALFPGALRRAALRIGPRAIP